MIENPRTGEQIDFVGDDPDVLVMYSTWTRTGHRAVEHVHPLMEERFEVLEGCTGFRVDGLESEAAAGDIVVVPPGVPHLAWNASEVPARLRIEMRPPLRWEEFTRRLFAGENPALLLDEYDHEIRLPPPVT